MNIAFFWTPEFAGNIFEWILAEIPQFWNVNILCLVSQPDKPQWRSQELFPTPTKLVAQKNNITVLQPEKIRKNPEFFSILKQMNLDFIVVVAYGKIIPKEILEIPKYGCINIHGSLLPKYRGASPVQAALKNGESETWLTIMYMSEGMDEGDILSVAKIQVDNRDTSTDIFRKFTQIWPKLLLETLQKIQSWEIQGIPQNQNEATYCSKISREDGGVFFKKESAQEIYNTFRAYTPWPGIFTFYQGKRFVLESISLFFPPEEMSVSSWKVVRLSKNRYGIVCADGNILEILKGKLEGKKSMDIPSFVNGNRDILEYEFL